MTQSINRRSNFQWYWQSNPNPWLLTEEKQWRKYTDIETEIIEDALQANMEEVEIDNNYIVRFKHSVQYKKLDPNRQRPIKRLPLDREESSRLREDRFSLPIHSNGKAFCSVSGRAGSLFLRNYEFNFQYKPYIELKYADIVEQAALGILEKGNTLEKTHEAEWIMKKLLATKEFGKEILLHDAIPDPIGQMCVYLYTKESFLYKIINFALGQVDVDIYEDCSGATCDEIQLKNIKTLGPFCYLLNSYLKSHPYEDDFIVYRGVTLTDEMIDNYRQYQHFNLFSYQTFTSTCKNRQKAEQSGNTLLIMHVRNESIRNGFPYFDDHCGTDISNLSDFPDEEEFLMWPAVSFTVKSVQFDSTTNKHIITIELACPCP